VIEFVLAAMVLAAIVIFVVSGPFRRGGEQEKVEEDRREALEAAKEAKYRDIRDAELDYRMGKLSEADWRAADAELRTQAIGILRELDRLEGREGTSDRRAEAANRNGES
jgi:uncharacterized membrane protein